MTIIIQHMVAATTNEQTLNHKEMGTPCHNKLAHLRVHLFTKLTVIVIDGHSDGQNRPGYRIQISAIHGQADATPEKKSGIIASLHNSHKATIY